MLFLMEEDLRPLPDDLKLWVNIIKYIKRGAPGGALSFFTYMELSKSEYLVSNYFVLVLFLVTAG